MNGQQEIPIGTVLLENELADFVFRENFISLKNLSNPLIVLCFLRKTNAVFDVTQSTLTLSYLGVQPKPDTQVALRQALALFAEIHTLCNQAKLSP